MTTKNYFKNLKTQLGKLPIFLVLSLFIVITVPILFTQSSSWFPNFDSETGAIGDTIGGITAPFIGFIAIILTCISLRNKREENLIEKEEKEKRKNFETLLRQIENLKKNITEFKSVSFNESQQISNQGTPALLDIVTLINHINKKGLSNNYSKINTLEQLLLSFYRLLKSVDKTLLEKDDKTILENRLNFIYSSYLQPVLRELFTPCDRCEDFHYEDSFFDKLIFIDKRFDSYFEKLILKSVT